MSSYQLSTNNDKLNKLCIIYQSNERDIKYYTQVCPIMGNAFIFVLKEENRYLRIKIQKLMGLY